MHIIRNHIQFSRNFSYKLDQTVMIKFLECSYKQGMLYFLFDWKIALKKMQSLQPETAGNFNITLLQLSRLNSNRMNSWYIDSERSILNFQYTILGRHSFVDFGL